MNAQYAWWTKALEIGGGRRLSREQQQALGITTEPQAGFYRKRNKDGQDTPVAIWHVPGSIVATAGDNPVNAVDVWTWCCQWPVSEQVWRDVAESGNAWPDDAPSVPKEHNQSSDPHEALTIEFAGEKELAESFLETPITTQEQADKAAVWSKRLAGIAKKAVDLHKVEKQPSLDEGRRIDDKWRDVREGADGLSKKLKRHMDDFLREQDRLEQERQRKAREEAARIQREADDARLAAERAAVAKVAEGISDAMAIKEHNDRIAEADRLSREAADAARDAEARNANAGRTGARVALRTFVSARVTDYHAAAKALLDANHRDLKDAIDQLANRAVKAGIELAGVERVEEKRAA
ncbi:hypothetical protein ACHMW7_16040 [Aminobacter sp. UC22_36]|uniref:hypothetical protein n=1 Tax=Aminobacter sp. UC22_36 TaxID=3374549 RepID=UPI003757F54A